MTARPSELLNSLRKQKSTNLLFWLNKQSSNNFWHKDTHNGRIAWPPFVREPFEIESNIWTPLNLFKTLSFPIVVKSEIKFAYVHQIKFRVNLKYLDTLKREIGIWVIMLKKFTSHNNTGASVLPKRQVCLNANKEDNLLIAHKENHATQQLCPIRTWGWNWPGQMSI